MYVVETRLDIALLKNGDNKAFERLFNLYWGKVYNFTGLFIKDEKEREDITQQVFVKVWEGRTKLDVDKSFEGFLFIVSRNLVFNHCHRSLKETTIDPALMAERGINPTEDISAGIEANSLKDYVSVLVEQLPNRQREAFMLSRLDGLSNKEIADKMGISIKGVERNIYLALKFLRLYLPLFLLFFIK